VSTIKTTLHAYEFDTTKPDGKTAWKAFEAERKASGARIFGPVFHEFGSSLALDGTTLELETKHLFDNQWTATAPGGKSYRVFDWFLQADHPNHISDACRPGVKRGHYLVLTDEILTLRDSTNACGYCGHQEPVALGGVFCPKCLSSPYLAEDHL
jgi:hypothetical protein